MTILFSLLFISIVGIIALVGYKYMAVSRMNVSGAVSADIQKHISSKVLKQKLHWLFSSANDRIVQRVVVRLKNTYGVVSKSISLQHTAFTDAVNGKGVYDPDKSQKGATSIFFQTMSEHKKKIQEGVRDKE